MSARTAARGDRSGPRRGLSTKAARSPARRGVLPCPVCGGPVHRTTRRDAPDASRSRRRAGAPRHLQIACPRCRYKLYEYPRLCVGFVVTRGDDVLVLIRGHQPRRGYLDLPGGFLEEGEDFERAARRELFEETALRVGPAELLGTYWDHYALPGFGSFPTLNYYYVAPWRSGTPRAGDDAAHAEWVPTSMLPRRVRRFAWRHMGRVLRDLMKRIRDRGSRTTP